MTCPIPTGQALLMDFWLRRGPYSQTAIGREGSRKRMLQSLVQVNGGGGAESPLKDASAATTLEEVS